MTAWLVVMEWPYHQLPDLPDGRFERVAVIGDSLSAAVPGNSNDWPALLEQMHSIEVDNLAVPGATVGDAVAGQLPQVQEQTDLMILLIGGNDLLSGTPPKTFQADLDELLGQLGEGQTQSTLLMFELPALPGDTAYPGAQRRLAREHKVHLLPRRSLLRVLGKRGNTSDGIHLTDRGHAAMAGQLARLLEARFSPIPTTDR